MREPLNRSARKKRRIIPAARILKAGGADRWVRTYGEMQQEIDLLQGEREDVKEAREAERARGYDEGYTEGAKEGAKMAARFLAAIKAEQNMFRNVIPQLVASIVEQIMRDVPEQDVIAKAALSILDENDERGPAVLKVSPVHLLNVNHELEAIAEAHGCIHLLDLLDVVPEASLPDDRSLLIFSDSVIELGLAAQMAALTDGLKDAFEFDLNAEEGAADLIMPFTEQTQGLRGSHEKH